MLLIFQIHCFAYNSTITFSKVSGQALLSLWPRSFDEDSEVEQVCKQYQNKNTYLSISLDLTTLQSKIMKFNYNQPYVNVELDCLQNFHDCIDEVNTMSQLRYKFLFNQINSDITATISTFNMEILNHEKCFSEIFIVPDLLLGVYTITFAESYPCNFEQIDVDIQMHIYPNLIWTHRVKNYNQTLVQFSGLAVECIDQSYSYKKCVTDVYDVYINFFFSGFIRIVTYNKYDSNIKNTNLRKYQTLIQQDIQGIRAVSYKNFYESLLVQFQGDKIHFITTLRNDSAFNTTEIAFLTLCVQEFKNFTDGQTWVFEQQILLFDFYQQEFWIDCGNASNVQKCKDNINLLKNEGKYYIYTLQILFMYYNFTLMEVYFDEATFVPACINAANLVRKDNQFCIKIIYLNDCIPDKKLQLLMNLFISNSPVSQYNITLQTGDFYNISTYTLFPSDFCFPPDDFDVYLSADVWGILDYAGHQIPLQKFTVEHTHVVNIEGICCVIGSLIASIGGFYLGYKSGPKKEIY